MREKKNDDKPKNKDEGFGNYSRKHKMNDFDQDNLDINEKGIVSLG